MVSPTRKQARFDWQIPASYEGDLHCIRANADTMRLAGSLLYRQATSLPAEPYNTDTNKPLNGIDHELQAACMVLALQLIAGGECAEDADMPYLLRQNTTTPCVLEQSTDGGQTWTIAFDFSLCERVSTGAPSTMEITNFIANSQTYIDTIHDDYDTNGFNASEVFCIWEAFTFPLNTTQEATMRRLLCMTAEMLVRQICLIVLDSKGKDALDLKDYFKSVASAFGAGTTVVTLMVAAGMITGLLATWLPISLALAGVGALLASGTISRDEDTYTDEDAILEVVCRLTEYLLDAIKTDGEVTLTEWNAIDLIEVGESEGERVYDLADTVSKVMDGNVELFLLWHRWLCELFTANGYSADGLPCNCLPDETQTCCRFWNFRLSQYAWDLYGTTAWQSGRGIYAVAAGGAFSKYQTKREVLDTDYAYSLTDLRIVVTFPSSTTATDLFVYAETVGGQSFQLVHARNPGVNTTGREFNWHGNINDVMNLSIFQDGFGNPELKELQIIYEAPIDMDYFELEDDGVSCTP